jgi:hypothetical protein
VDCRVKPDHDAIGSGIRSRRETIRTRARSDEASHARVDHLINADDGITTIESLQCAGRVAGRAPRR